MQGLNLLLQNNNATRVCDNIKKSHLYTWMLWKPRQTKHKHVSVNKVFFFYFEIRFLPKNACLCFQRKKSIEGETKEKTAAFPGAKGTHW